MKISNKLKCILLLIIINSLTFSEESIEKRNPDTRIETSNSDRINKYGEFKFNREYEKSSSNEENERIGLSLGGGSAKGLSHIGILKVLYKEKVPIEYVTGTSMGSIVGGLYSSGYSPEEIENIAENLDWIGLFIDKIDRNKKHVVRNLIEDRNTVTVPLSKVPLGVTGGNNAIKKLNELFFGVLGVKNFSELPIPFASVATNLNTGTGDTLNTGSLPLAIRSSLSLPGLFNPINRNSDKIYVDGGMVRNTPFQDLETIYLSRLSTEQKNLNLQKSLIVKKLEENSDNEELQKKLSLLEDKTEKLQHLILKGKPYSIGINVGAGFENKDINKITIMDVLLDSSTLAQRTESEWQKGMFSDIYIAPNLEKINSYEFTKAKEIIKIGENIANAHIDDIKKMSNPERFDEVENQRISFRAETPNKQGNYCYISICAESPNKLKKAIKKMTDSDIWKISSYNISSVEVRGNDKYKNDYFNKYLKKANGIMNRETMEKITDEIYRNGNFSLVYYELEEDGNQNAGLDKKITDKVELIKAKKYKLIINVQEKAGQYLTASLNANTENLVTLGLGLQGNSNSLRYQINGILGEEYGANGVAIMSLIPNSGFLGLGEFEYKRDKIKNQNYLGKDYDYDNRKIKTGLGLGLTLTPNTLISVSGGYQRSNVKENLDETKNKKISFPYYQVSLIHDNRDDIAFPTKGTYLKADYVKGNSKKANFDTTYFNGEINIPVSKLTITPSITYVTSNGTGVPETYKPRLGGFSNSDYSLEFGGIKPDKMSANSIFVGKLNLQYPIMEILRSQLYINANMSVARISNEAYKVGKKEIRNYGAGIGINVPFIGPINLGFAKSPKESIRYVLNIGYSPKAFNGN